jgi:hypothetical protein
VASVQSDFCVQVTNISATEQSLGGFTLKSVSEGVEIAYKFHRTVKVSLFMKWQCLKIHLVDSVA